MNAPKVGPGVRGRLSTILIPRFALTTALEHCELWAAQIGQNRSRTWREWVRAARELLSDDVNQLSTGDEGDVQLGMKGGGEKPLDLRF